MAEGSFSFRSFSAQATAASTLPGTKPSMYGTSNRPICSTGVPTMDFVLAGGLSLGTILLVEEDRFGTYSKLLSKYFICEGILSEHSILLAAPEPESMLKTLPAPVTEDPGIETLGKGQGSDEKMRIAWRYHNISKIQSTPMVSRSRRFGNYYDLTKNLDADILQNAKTFTFSPVSEAPPVNEETESSKQSSCGSRYEKLLEFIESTVQGHSKETVLRIVLAGLGSPLWGEDLCNSTDHSAQSQRSLWSFLYRLHCILADDTRNAVCLVTIPTHLMRSEATVFRLEHVCDYALRLESFAGSDKETNPVYKDFNGLVHILKLPTLCSLRPHMPDTYNWVFKLRRKRFTIEKLHLPPDLSETVSRVGKSQPVLSGKGDPSEGARLAGGSPCMTGGLSQLTDF